MFANVCNFLSSDEIRMLRYRVFYRLVSYIYKIRLTILCTNFPPPLNRQVSDTETQQNETTNWNSQTTEKIAVCRCFSSSFHFVVCLDRHYDSSHHQTVYVKAMRWTVMPSVTFQRTYGISALLTISCLSSAAKQNHFLLQLLWLELPFSISFVHSNWNSFTSIAIPIWSFY